MNVLLHACNKTSASFDQSPLYAAIPESVSPPWRRRNQRPGSTQNSVKLLEKASVFDASKQFHVSIAWTLVEPTSVMETAAAEISTSRLEKIDVPVKSVKAKVGNVVTSIALDSRDVEGRGILGL